MQKDGIESRTADLESRIVRTSLTKAGHQSLWNLGAWLTRIIIEKVREKELATMDIRGTEAKSVRTYPTIRIPIVLNFQ
jgi:hypothetical protein